MKRPSLRNDDYENVPAYIKDINIYVNKLEAVVEEAIGVIEYSEKKDTDIYPYSKFIHVHDWAFGKLCKALETLEDT